MADFLNLVSKEQFQELIEVQKVIAGFGKVENVASWAEVQEVVRRGKAADYFSVGDLFVANYNNSPAVWDVIGINHDTPVDGKYTNSLTIQAHDCLMNVVFDAAEALFYATTELAAGTHVFTMDSGKYQFTTTQAVPVGGQVFISDWGEGSYIPTKIATYAANRTTVIETGLVVTVSTGENTLTPVNHQQRCRYGSNNYMESAVRQWLNSEATTFTWAAKTNFDRPVSGAPFTGGGFLKLLDPELTAVIGKVNKQVAKNTVTDGGGQGLFDDKVFLLSRTEVYGTTEGVVTGEKVYPYYSALAGAPSDAALTGRIKYLSGSARYWWLRSPSVGHSVSPRIVYLTGTVDYYTAVYGIGLAPACCIV